jgi:hypothetical protein
MSDGAVAMAMTAVFSRLRASTAIAGLCYMLGSVLLRLARLGQLQDELQPLLQPRPLRQHPPRRPLADVRTLAREARNHGVRGHRCGVWLRGPAADQHLADVIAEA